MGDEGGRLCGDCNARPGELHKPGCDVEPCPRCGGQAISCGCVYEVNGLDRGRLEETHPEVYTGGPTKEMADRFEAEWGHRRLPWTGRWPGESECYEFGLYCRWIDGGTRVPLGWVPCDKDHPDAGPDLNRLTSVARWHADKGRWVLRGKP